MNAIISIANHLQSRTVLAIIVLALLLFVPEFREVVVQVFNVLPEDVETVVKESSIPELIVLVSAWYFRVNPQAEL